MPEITVGCKKCTETSQTFALFQTLTFIDLLVFTCCARKQKSGHAEILNCVLHA